MCLIFQQNVSIVVERRIFFLNCTYILPNIIIDYLDAKHERSYSLTSLSEALKKFKFMSTTKGENILQKVTFVAHMT